MSYCVALKLDRGLIFMSDTLTNGGLDNISCYPKTFKWGVDGERQIFLSTAGNLATTQAVVSTLSEQTKPSATDDLSILKAPTMFQVARIVSKTLSKVIGHSAEGQQGADSAFSATMILGGQIANDEMRLYLIYPEGNFIEVSASNPFFQIGETKYGRPILVRAFDPAISFSDAIKLLMVSFDSTIKANLSVGLPLDINIYHNDSLADAEVLRVSEDDPYYQMISSAWGEALKASMAQLPEFTFETGG